MKRSLEITCSIGPITIIGTRVIIQKACLKPFSSHAPVNTHISNEKGTYNLYNNRKLLVIIKTNPRLAGNHNIKTKIRCHNLLKIHHLYWQIYFGITCLPLFDMNPVVASSFMFASMSGYLEVQPALYIIINGREITTA